MNLQNAVLALYFLSLTVLFVFGIHDYVMVYYYRKHREVKEEAIAPLTEFPRVTVQLPIYNEMYVVERLIRAACNLDYPKERLQIQVLDDSTDETLYISQKCVEEYRQKGYDIQLLHREERTGYKASALREALAHATGAFIAIFDADFIPPPNFLRRTLPHFNAPDVGMVQTRWEHLNREFSAITRAQAIGLDGHFVIEQTARSRAGFFINFNGTGGVWRKECIVDAGNWQDDTLTEDLDLSYRAQLRGWKFKFLKDTTCLAELPSEMNALKSQLFRWTKGAMSTAKKILPLLWKSKLSLLIKTQGTIHLTNNFVFPFMFLVALLNVPVLFIKNLSTVVGEDARLDSGSHHSFYFTITSIFMLAFFGSFLLYLYAEKEVHSDWRKKMLAFPIFMVGSMGLSLNNTRAVIEGLLNKRSEFRRTPKYRIENPEDHWRDKRYHYPIDFLVVGEILMAGYCLFGVIMAARLREFAAIPLQLVFLIGYAFIAFLSLKHYLEAHVKAFRAVVSVALESTRSG